MSISMIIRKIGILFLIFVQASDAARLQNSWNPDVFMGSKDDLTTDYAKEVMRYAKAAEIKSHLNTKVDPCVDFYQFACGNWHYSNPAQLLSNIMTDKFQELSKAFNHRLITLLNHRQRTEGEDDVANPAQKFYRGCKYGRSDDIQYELSLRKIIENFGEMPVLLGEKWNETNFKWWEAIARIQNKYGIQILLSVEIMGDIKNKSESQRIYMGPPHYSVIEDTKLMNFLQEATLAHELEFHFKVDAELARKTAKEIIAFERELSLSGTDSRLGINIQDMLSLQSVGSLAVTYAESFDLKRYLELVLGSEPPESIYVFDEKYLHNALELIEATPKHIVANYVFWMLMKDFFLDDQKENEVAAYCVDKTKKFFGEYIDQWVYSHYRNEVAEQEIFDVFDDLRATFREALRGNKLDWISNHTREYAVSKLDAMKIMINSHDNENFTEQYYQLNLNLDPHVYVENVEKVLMFNSRKALNKLVETNSSTPEDQKVLSFTPTYNIVENNIKIPVAFLQPRHFWSEDYPKAIKYATLGFLIAHEMIHGFDDEGRKFGKDGIEYVWWDPKSTYEFDERRKCFQAQYHGYEYGGKALPESISQTENIADNAGVKLAYAAYTHWLNHSKLVNDSEAVNKETLPNLPFSNRQLFFISYAQVLCEDVQSLFRTTIVSGDSHAPGMYRVIGSLSNFQEFSWVFNCKPDAPMAPHYRCLIY